MNKTFKWGILVALALALGFTSFACGERTSPNARRFELKGKVVSVEADKQQITVAHEEIKDYMPSMTMPFNVKDASAFSILRPGDEINARLVVDGTRSWLEDLVIRQESVDSGTVEVPVEAKPGDEVPNYGLVNQDGKPIKLHNYRGKALLLTFIFTRCPEPDQCTLMSENFVSLEQSLRSNPELFNKTHLLSVSFDPEFDTPAVLRSYGAAHTGRYSNEDFEHWEFASGTPDQVKGIAQYFGLRYYSGNNQIIHGLRTAVISPDGKVHKVYRGNEWKPEEVLRDVQQIIGNKPSD